MWTKREPVCVNDTSSRRAYGFTPKVQHYCTLRYRMSVCTQVLCTKQVLGRVHARAISVCLKCCTRESVCVCVRKGTVVVNKLMYVYARIYKL